MQFDINSVSMKNFMSYGNNEQSFNFQHNTSTLIVGENRDVGGTGTSRNGVGKCHGVDTPILMADGSIKMVQDVVVGDKLMGDDGSPRNVLSLATGEEELFLVKQNKGMDYVVNKSHILSLKCGTNRPLHGLHKGDVVNIPLEKYLEFPNAVKKSVCGYIADLRKFGTNDVFEPWLFGLWLADGTSTKPEITINKNDTEILENFYATVERNGWNTRISPSSDRENCQNIYVKGGFDNKLRSLGVRGNKHIPVEYKHGTYENRIELLSGMIDGDGYLYNNMYELTLKDTKLVDDIVFIARSVGFRVIVRDKFSKCPNFDGDIYKRITISGDIEKLNCRLTRKSGTRKNKTVNIGVTGIRVESIGVGKYYGFEIDGNHLYCLGDMTVTHNTSVFNAVAFALFGAGVDTELKADQYVNWFNKKHCVVTVTATVNKQQYRITRKRKPSSLTLELIDDTGDVVENLTHDSMANTQNMIESLLGMDREIFMMVYYLTPNRFAFMSEKPARQRDLIEKILNLKALTDRANVLKDVIRKNVQGDLRVAEKALESAKANNQSQQARLDDLINKQQSWDQNKETSINEKQAELDRIDIDDDKVDEFISILASVESYNDMKLTKQAEHNDLVTKRNQAHASATNAKQLHSRIEDANKRLSDAQSQRDALSTELESVGDVVQQFDLIGTASKNVDAVQRLYNDIEKKIESLTADKKQKIALLDDIENELTTSKQQLSELPTQEELDVEFERFQNNERREAQIKQLKNELTVLQRSDKTQQQIEQLDKQITELEAGTCPTCKQTHYDEELVSSLKEQRSSVLAEQESINKSTKDISDKIDKITSEFEDEVEQSILNELQTKLNNINSQVRELESKKSFIDLSTIDKELNEAETDIQFAKTEVNTAKNKLNELEQPTISLEEFYSLNARFNASDDQINDLQNEIAALNSQSGDYDDAMNLFADLDLQVREAETKLNDVNIALNDAKTALNAHEYSSLYNSVSDIDRVKYRIDTLKTQISEIELSVNPYTELVKEFVIPSIEKEQQTVQHLTKKLEHCGYLIRLLTSSESFIRKSIIAKYVGFLNKRINEYTTRLNLPHVIQVNSDLTVDIYKISEPVSYYNMSAGERLRLNTATAAAFKDLLGTLGSRFNLLMIDELMDGSLDPDGMNKSFELLCDISDTMMVISHRTEFHDRVDNVLTIVKEAEFSRLEFQ